ncbi:MAG: hypothetical protein R3D33_07630 [Hyphomicrobiaceae bacterium]
MRQTSVPALASLGLAAFLLGACAGGPTAGGPCLDDSQACVASRVAMVDAAWSPIPPCLGRQPVSRETYQSGVRLFAWRSTMDRMSCDELGSGIREMALAKQSLSQGPLPGVSAERNNQVKALTDDTRTEIERTAKSKRCRV